MNKNKDDARATRNEAGGNAPQVERRSGDDRRKPGRYLVTKPRRKSDMEHFLETEK